VAALIFLDLNGFDFDAPEDDFAEMVLAGANSASPMRLSSFDASPILPDRSAEVS